MVLSIIKPYKLDDVREELEDVGVLGVTVMEVKGCGRTEGHTELYRGAEYVVDFLPKVLIMVLVSDAISEKVKETISKFARTGKHGDGIIWDIGFDEYTRISTEEIVNDLQYK